MTDHVWNTAPRYTGTHGIVSPLIRGAGAAIGVLTLAVLALTLIAGAASARQVDRFISSLSSAERSQFEKHLTAKTFYNAALDAYWQEVEAKRKGRKRKKRADITRRDYVTTLPPDFQGPELSNALNRKWKRHLASLDAGQPSKPASRMSDVSDFLAASRKHYGFTPERISEPEFKRRYAREALRLGLSKTQVVRVYALETGGDGTADMQAGIHPITKKGRPISSAIGYAQLLHANSINELRKHGKEFLWRLKRTSEQSDVSAARRARLAQKIEAVGRMYKAVRQLPDKWSRHMAFARTNKGQGIHALNLDGDVGPWLQVIKLKGLRGYADRAGRTTLSSSELELMNLAGPGTGLEMMTPVGAKMPTTNFFSRMGYNRNGIVRGKTATGLLKALKERMDYNVRRDGAKEFARIFDELLQRRAGQ